MMYADDMGQPRPGTPYPGSVKVIEIDGRIVLDRLLQIHDMQDGQLKIGYPVRDSITQFGFQLIDLSGNNLGFYDISNLYAIQTQCR